MNKYLLGFAGAAAAFALIVSILVAPTSSAATEIVVWAEVDRGTNLTKVIATKGDWVPGYSLKVVTFPTYDALLDAFAKATEATGPDIVLGYNSPFPSIGNLAPIELSASVKSRFNPKQFFDLTFKGKIYGVPVDVTNVGMIYNTKLVSTAPKSFAEMVTKYKSLKASKGLTAGLCIAGGGMSWGAYSVFSALGAEAYLFNSRNEVVYGRGFIPAAFGQNVRRYLMDDKKSNGFFPATDSGCKDNFLAGKVPYAVIGSWESESYIAKGFTMNVMPVPGVKEGTYGKMFEGVSGAFLTKFAAKHGTETAAKLLLTNFFASTNGQVRYQAIEKRVPAEKGARTDSSLSAAQRGFGSAANLAGIPQIGAFLNSNKGGASYWDSAPTYWTAVLVEGKDPVVEASKLAAIWRANTDDGKGKL